MARTILITGGARSGKSRFAESVARRQNGRVLFVATAEALDDEMIRRIRRHRERRPTGWRTVEAPRDLLAALDGREDGATVLVDCLTVWIANRLLDLGDPERPDWADRVSALEGALIDEVTRLIVRSRAAGGTLILVTNEVGWDVVPPYPLGRAFRDLVGQINQAVAEVADGVFVVVAGLPVELKRAQEPQG
jgi:adenosylcobinamide kinase/adenosylcobinamide-phosphate guanylyltransferase